MKRRNIRKKLVNPHQKHYPVLSTKQATRWDTLDIQDQARNQINSITIECSSIRFLKLARNRWYDTVIGYVKDCEKQDTLVPGRLMFVESFETGQAAVIGTRAENPLHTRTPRLAEIIRDDEHEITWINILNDVTKENVLCPGRLMGIERGEGDDPTVIMTRAENQLKTTTPRVIRIIRQDQCERTYIDVDPNGIAEITDPRRTTVSGGKCIAVVKKTDPDTCSNDYNVGLDEPCVDSMIQDNVTIVKAGREVAVEHSMEEKHNVYTVHQNWFTSTAIAAFEPVIADVNTGLPVDTSNMLWFDVKGLFVHGDGRKFVLQSILWVMTSGDRIWRSFADSVNTPEKFFHIGQTDTYMSHTINLRDNPLPSGLVKLHWQVSRVEEDNTYISDSYMFYSNQLTLNDSPVGDIPLTKNTAAEIFDFMSGQRTEARP